MPQFPTKNENEFEKGEMNSCHFKEDFNFGVNFEFHIIS